jgi:hypothetical protein
VKIPLTRKRLYIPKSNSDRKTWWDQILPPKWLGLEKGERLFYLVKNSILPSVFFHSTQITLDKWGLRGSVPHD